MLKALHFTPWVFLPAFATALVAVVAHRAWAQRSEPGGIALVALALTSGWWTATQAGILMVEPVATKKLLEQWQYLGVVSAPLAWLWFALSYTGRSHLLRGLPGLVAVVPVTTLVLVATNAGHHLVWESADLWKGIGPALRVDHGPWFPVHRWTSWGMVALATVILIWHHAQSPHHRARIAAVLAAPLSVVALDLLWPSPEQAASWIDPTPTGFALANAVLAWGLFRQGRLVMAPVARTIVVEEMADVIVVLNRDGHIVDLNRAATETLGLEPMGPLPVPVGTAWARSRKSPNRRDPAVRLELRTVAGKQRIFEMTSTGLGPRGGSGRSVVVLRDVTERERMERELREKSDALHAANAELERLANTDGLTGLANRRHFTEELEREVERCRRYGRPFSVVLLDLDHFKSVNDTWGHAAGDAVLEATADAMREVCRDIDLPGRIGGEELALLLPETDLDGAAALADRLRERIGNRVHQAPTGGSFKVTASLGVATLVPEMRTGEALLQATDEALYAAKGGGRNRVVVAGEG